MAVMIQLLSLCLLVLLVEGSTQTNTTTTPDTSTQITTTTTSEGSTQTNTTTTPDVSTQITTTTTSEGSTQTNTTTTPEGTTQTTTTTAPGPCSSNPCPFDSNCQELLTNYTCVCRPGLFYDAKLRSCNLAKTFPSDIRFTKMDYNSNMADKNSEIFQQKANDILKEINTVLTNTDGYLGSVVKSLSKGSVIADVENFYSPLSKVDEVTVQTELRNLPETEVKMKDICSTGFCEETSTDCDSKTGLAECSCKNGYIKLTATQQACFPCPSGEKAVGSEKCEQCPFGYSGFNCKESYLLILVVVACVLGILLLGTLIGAIVLYLRSTKETKSPGKNSPNGNLEFNKPAGIPRIPRANPNGGWQPTNLEMADSGSRNALVTKDTDNTRMWDYAYIDDARSQKSQTSFRTGYGASGANNGPKANRNPYYDAYEDKMRRY
ncbi:mucin-13b isoform X2 [Ictalurus punctatus]|uniref:Mucin-13b isoform X2 n=1 Tax=Ictalurus punctatus TaxID=7998 RepID=A0A9F7TQ63_ICTPU|nr:mucin-13b isoform X2 [Ictalurus punctatus]